MSLEWFRCETCGQKKLKGYSGRGPVCYDCSRLRSGKGLDHSHMVRCPKCHHVEDAVGDDNYGLYEEGEHGFECSACEHSYTVYTHVSYSFESPENVDPDESNAL